MFNIEKNPIIAAVRTESALKAALRCPAKTIFLLHASILNLHDVARDCKASGKQIFLHIDLAEGLGKDAAGLRYVSNLGVDGIISTRANLIRTAKECGLKTVQRFFIVDSQSIATATDSALAVCPDLLEVMPGVVPKIIEQFCANLTIPVIAGGLIETKEDVIRAIKAGAAGISTTKEALWYE